MLQLQNVAKRVTISRKSSFNVDDNIPFEEQQHRLPPKTTLKDSVKCFTTDGVEFIDGSRQTFTTIIYATGEINFRCYCFLSFTHSFFLNIPMQAIDIHIHF